MPKNGMSLSDNVFQLMLSRIRSGEWRPGTVIPSQRQLVEEFGISGVPLREALSMMKTLGILEIQQGRKSIVRQLDTEVLEQLFPLVFCLEGEQCFDEVNELRLALEPRAAMLAAKRRSDKDVEELTRLVAMHRDLLQNDDDPRFFEADLNFHLRIAEATRNPFFRLLQGVFSNLVIRAQMRRGCGFSLERRQHANRAHESILYAIANKDAQGASIEMEAHVRESKSHHVLMERSSAEYFNSEDLAAISS